MAGRNLHYPAASSQSRTRDLIDNHRLISSRHQTPANHATVIEAQKREIQILLGDNQRLAASHIALKQELNAANQDLRQLSSTAAKIKAEYDARVREVYEISLKTEAELRSVNGMSADFSQVKTDIDNMSTEITELALKLREINNELAVAPSELAELPAVEEELRVMRQEVGKGRAAVEYEKKMQVINHEQSQIMEKNMDSLASEVEKLHVELANAEKRAVAAEAATAAPPPPPGPVYPSVYATPDYAYGGNFHSEHYIMQQATQAGGINAAPQYGPGGVPLVPGGSCNFQQPSAHM